MTRALLLLIDGLRPDIATAELEAGHLPHLAALTARGSRTVAATAFPSTTSVAYLPFLTGCLPGRCNVPSIRWLDRSAYRGRWWQDRDAVRSYCGWQAGHLDRDIADDVTTLFELVPESVAIFSPVTRGLAPEGNRIGGARKFWGTISHYTENHQPGDDAVARELVRLASDDWRFCFAQFPAVDGHTHAAHPGAPRVLASLREVDATIGRLVEALRRTGRLEDTLIAVVSDHGAAPVDQHLDLATWFRARGTRTLAHPVLWTRDPAVAVMVAGNAQAAIYAQPNAPRPHRHSFGALSADGALGVRGDAVAQLLAEPAVALVAAEDGEGGITVASAGGRATLRRVGGGIAYARHDGDPLGIGVDATADDADWLARTIDGPYPDGPTALLDQFRSPRTGDLVIAAAAGWDFREAWEYPEHRAGHGSLIAAHMRTPLWTNQPLPDRAAWRTVDVFPLLCRWLGVPVPEGIDGR
jgi:hypothetical protein